VADTAVVCPTAIMPCRIHAFWCVALWHSVVPTFQENVLPSFSTVEKFDPSTLEDEGTNVGTLHPSDAASYPRRRGSSRDCCSKPNPAYFH
jgi:hypothetical protein